MDCWHGLHPWWSGITPLCRVVEGQHAQQGTTLHRVAPTFLTVRRRGIARSNSFQNSDIQPVI